MLRRFWTDEAGDMVANLGIMATICVGLAALLAAIELAVTRTSSTFIRNIPGVTVGE